MPDSPNPATGTDDVALLSKAVHALLAKSSSPDQTPESTVTGSGLSKHMPEHALDSSGSAPASRTASSPPSVRPSGPHSAIPSGHVSGQVSGQVSGRQTPMSHEARSRRNSQFKRADTGPVAAFAMTSLSSASATDGPASGTTSAPTLSRRPSSGPVRSRPPSRRPSTGVFGAVAAAFTRTNSARGRTETDEVVLADVLSRLTKLFTVDVPAMRRIVSAFVDDLGAGLDRYDHTVAMIPTFVFGSPTGAEMGDFIAVDLGGTNLRVCHVSLLGQGDSPTQDDDQPKFELTQVKYRLSEDQKQDSGEKLFDFCAECIMLFMHEQFDDPDSGELDLPDGMALGFTFSYPCKQDRIDHGQLIRWTKGFGASGVEGQDACQLFTSALQARGCPLPVTAIINDTTGTLIASSYVDANTKIAVILGTGCNAAYMETMGNIKKMKGLIPDVKDDEQMAINCEYGAFDSFKHEHLPRTKYDIVIDQSSNKPDEQAYEKMISGLYLGEIFRLILCELIDDGTIFLGQNTYKLEKVSAFETSYLSLMESDPTDELLTMTGLFTHFYGIDTTLKERKFLRQIANLIGTRAARLSACGIIAIAERGGYIEHGCGVACDGSLYSKYPNFASTMHAAFDEVLGEKGKGIRTHHAEDGSGVGAAIIAAMTKIRKDEGRHVDF